MRLGVARSFVCAFALLAIINCAWADTVTLGGLSFSVDSIQPVDADLAKVKLFGHETLVAKDAIGAHVAREYFSSFGGGSQKFTQRELEGFVLSTSVEGLHDIASLALTSMIEKPGVNNRQLLNFLESFASDTKNVEIVKRTLLKISSSSNQKEVSVSLALDLLAIDSLWLREHLASWFFVSLDEIRPIVIERYNKMILADNRARAQTLLSNWREMVGAEDPTFRDLSAIDSRVSALSDRLAKHDIIGAAVMVDFSDTRPVMHDLLVPMYISAAEQESSNLLAQSQPNAAITILLHIDFMRRTPRMHQLLGQAIAAPGLDLRPLLRDGAARSILRLYAEKDEALGQSILGSTEQFFEMSVSQAQLSDAEEALKLVCELRPDPDRRNGQLRLDLAAGYLRLGERARAEQHIDQARTMIAWGDYLRVFGLIVRSDWVVLTLLLILLLGSGSLLYYKVAPFLGRTFSAVRIAKSQRIDLDLEDELDEELPRFVQFSGTQGNPDYEEYRRCLVFFQLEPEATLSAIKSSYRAFVKEHHPDAYDGDKSSAAKEEFIKALEIYNRILELRKKFTSAS